MIAFLGFVLCLAGIGIVLIYPRQFFGILWRIFLFFLLWPSGVCLIQGLAYPSAEYRTQFIVAGSIGLFLSISGLVRSFLKKA